MSEIEVIDKDKDGEERIVKYLFKPNERITEESLEKLRNVEKIAKIPVDDDKLYERDIFQFMNDKYVQYKIWNEPTGDKRRVKEYVIMIKFKNAPTI
ncbi:MAG: hypothetical protein WC933_02535 [Candidatus Paceibacterota bacterium]|jgi:hypothetical protein